MEITQDKIDLIEKIIKNDKKFANNEDLYDDFFNETCRRSLAIVKTVSSDTALEGYLKKIATTSILNVLKNEGRLRRTSQGFTPIKNVSLETSTVPDYSKTEIRYETVEIQETPEDLAVKKDILQALINKVYEVSEKFPEKNYSLLYNLRYEKGLTQNEIAQELNISQSEVSKRLFKLMYEVKQAFRNNEMSDM